MTQSIVRSIAGLSTLIAACTSVPSATAQSPAAPPADGDAAATAAPITGTVVETMSSGGYTYVQVDDGTKKVWAAGPLTTVAVGDKVALPDGMPMRDFSSKTLGRTFAVIYFAPAIHVVGATDLEQMKAAHHAPGHTSVSTTTAAAVDLAHIEKAAGGQTVAELFARKATLAGKPVVVRGRVVKFVPAVMGKNWIHVRDGSGTTGTNDLTVSADASAAVGDLVLVRGTLGTDRDLGAGYHYEIIIEDAAVTVE